MTHKNADEEERATKFVHVYEFQENEFLFRGHSPWMTTLGETDESSLVVCGFFEGKTPDGIKFIRNDYISKNAILTRLWASDVWQKKHGYIGQNGLTPAATCKS